MATVTQEPEQMLAHVLERAARDGATEIRFVSGMAPSLICPTGPRFLKIAYLSADFVFRLHKFCLTKAEESGILTGPSARYRINLGESGRFQCDYRLKGTTASLTLRPYKPSAPPASRPSRRKPE